MASDLGFWLLAQVSLRFGACIDRVFSSSVRATSSGVDTATLEAVRR